jgi:hypothetical protein
MAPRNATKPATGEVNGLRVGGGSAGKLDLPDSALRISTQAVLPPRNNDRVVELDGARRRLDHGVDLMQEAIELRQQLYFGLDLDHAVELVEQFKRAVDAHRRAS